MNYLLVFIGGGLGSISRFGISKWMSGMYQGNFPLATLLSNVLACAVLGVTLLYFREKGVPSEWQWLVLSGYCGGFSTFSTFSHETVQLIQNNQYGIAVLNILISLIACLALLFILSKMKL